MQNYAMPTSMASRELLPHRPRSQALSEQFSTASNDVRSIGGMGPRTMATYDAHADWYNDFMSAAAGEYIQRVHATIGDLLGPGEGTCLDVCCGTGAHAPALAELGWTPVGVDLSSGQLRHAARRQVGDQGAHSCECGSGRCYQLGANRECYAAVELHHRPQISALLVRSLST